MVALPGVIPPGGSTTVGVSSLVGQLVGSATTPTEITAAMLATLAGSSGLSEQRKVLIQLTEKVEEQKRAIQQQMQLTQQTNAPKTGGSTVAPSTESKMAPTSRLEPVTVAMPTLAVSLAKPVPSIPLPLVTPDLYMPKSEPSLNIVTTPPVANRNLTPDSKLQPVSSSKVSAASAQPLGSLPLRSLPAENKKVPGVIPNVARKRLAEKTGVTPPTTTGATPLSGNLSLLPPSVQMLLMGGPVQTPGSGSDKTHQESQPAPDSSSSSANVTSPVVGGTAGDAARTVEGVEKLAQDKASDKVSIKPNSTGPTQTTTGASIDAASGNANTVSDTERTSRPSDVDPVVLNPHGDVDYRIAPTGRFPAPPPGPPASDSQSSWQPAFQTKPQEVSTSPAGPKSEWTPAFPAAVSQQQPDWAAAVPAAKPAWEPAFPAEASRPADPRQRAAEERMRNAAFPPNAGRSDGPRQDEGGVRPLMWNTRPPIQGRPPMPGPWGGAPLHPRFGAMPRPPLPPMRMCMPPPPPSIPNAAPMPSGDIDERIRPPWPPGGVTRPWPPSEVRPPLPPPPPDNAVRHKPAAVLNLDLSALGKFAVEFVKEQQQKGQGIIPPITSCSTAIAPPPANALGLSIPASTTSKLTSVSTHGVPLSTSARGVPPSSSAHGVPATSSIHGVPPTSSAHGVPTIVPPPASHPVGGQPGTLLGTATTKSSDTDERHHNDRGQHASQVTCSSAKFQDALSTSQMTNWTQQRLVGHGVTPLSQQPDTSKQNVAAKSSQKECAAHDKLTTTASFEKTKMASGQKEGAKSDGDRTAKNIRVGEVAGITRSKWVPLGASVPKQPQNVAATAPPGAVTVQRASEEASAAPSPGKNRATPTKVTPVQIKQLGKSLVETKTSQLLDPVEAKPLLTSLAEIKLAQRSVNETSTPTPVDVRAAKGGQQCSSGEKSQQPRGRGESKTEETALVRHNTDSRSSGEAVSVSDPGSTRSTKDGEEREREREKERAKAGRGSSTRSSDGGHRHRSRSRSREKQKERRRSHSRDRQRRERDRRRSRSRSRGRDRDRRATKQRSRSRSHDGKRRSRSRERQAKRRSRSRSRDRGIKRRSRSRDREAKRDRDVRRRSRSRSRERHLSFRSDRGRHERRVESDGRRSPPAGRHERVSREDRVSNDEVFSHSQDIDHRTTGHGDRDERYMSSIPTVGGQAGITDTTTSKPPEKPVMEGGQDTDERVLAAPFVGNAAEPWSGRPPRDSITGNVTRATGDKDDREQWRRRGGQELFAEQQVRLDMATGAAPRAGDPHMPPVPFARPLGDRPFMPPPPGEPMMTPPRPPPAWMPPMMAPRPPQMRPVGPPEQLPFPPRGPDRGWPRGPPGGRPGPW